MSQQKPKEKKEPKPKEKKPKEPKQKEKLSDLWDEIQSAIQCNVYRNEQLTFESHEVSTTPSLSLKTSGPFDTTTVMPIQNPISLILYQRDPLYRITTQSIRHVMEIEEKNTLLSELESAWKTFHGKERGWVRKHLEESLSQSIENLDYWTTVQTNKKLAQMIDYICIVRGLRISIWWEDKVTVIPFKDKSLTGKLIHIRADTSTLFEFEPTGDSFPLSLYTQKEITWIPPVCAPSMGSQTIAQIQSQLKEFEIEDGPKMSRSELWNLLMWESFKRSLIS